MLQGIDLFSGAGGLSVGFELTNKCKILAGFDSFEPAVNTFYKNHNILDSPFNRPIDVTKIFGKDILKSLNLKKLDFVIGGPPCQGFSVAGKRNIDDNRNLLVWEFLRITTEIMPQFFVMENVPGLLRAEKNDQLIIEGIRSKFEESGYHCQLLKLNSAEYGVPQVRRRAFLVGSLEKWKLVQPRPTSKINDDLLTGNLPMMTVEDAFSDLPSPTLEEPQPYTVPVQNAYQKYLRKGSTNLYNHTPSVHRPDMVKKMKAQKSGTRLYPNWNHSWYKLDLSRPSPTVKQNNRAPFVHPLESRVTTPRECARLQSFPDNYVFYGTKTAQLIQIGNAVPPLLAKELANSIFTSMNL